MPPKKPQLSPWNGAMFVGAWAIAIGVIYHRYITDTDAAERFQLRVQTMLSNKVMADRKGYTCGLLLWNNYTLVSHRVVLPDGVKPAARECEPAGGFLQLGAGAVGPHGRATPHGPR